MMNMQLEIPKNLPDLDGEICLITGAALGIGRCLALSFAKAGAHVIAADLDESAGVEMLALLEEQGCQADFVKTDISNEEQVKTFINKAAAIEGRIDFIINNAAIANAGSASVFSESSQAFDRVIAVNLRGPFLMAHHALPYMRQQGGVIINIASSRAFMSEAKTEGYAASKGGLVALSHALAMSLAPFKIRVNSVSPGWIDTTSWQKNFPQPIEWPEEEHLQHPAGRIGKPADIAAACLWLCSEDTGFITAENIMVDGGMTKKMIYLD